MFQVLHRSAGHNSQRPPAVSKRRPSDKHLQPEPSYTTAAGFNYSPWAPQYGTSSYQVSSPAANCRCPPTFVDPPFIPSQDLYRFSDPHQNPQRSSFAGAKPSLSVPFYPTNDGFRSVYPAVKDVPPSGVPLVGLGGVSEYPVDLSYSKNLPKQLTPSAQDKPKSSIDSLLCLYSRMNMTPPIPVTTANNNVANLSSLSTRTVPKLEPAPSAQYSLMNSSQGPYEFASEHSAPRIPTGQDDVKTYFTTTRDDFNFSTVWDHARQTIPTVSTQTGGGATSTNILHDDNQVSFMPAQEGLNYTRNQETIPTPSSYGLDHSPVWGESSIARLFLNL